MAKCPGLHCPGCGDGGGGLAAVAAAVVIVGALIARPVIAAAEAVLRVVVDVIEVTAIVLASGVVLAAVAAVVILARRASASPTRSDAAITWTLRPGQTLTGQHRPAVGAPRRLRGAGWTIGPEPARRGAGLLAAAVGTPEG